MQSSFETLNERKGSKKARKKRTTINECKHKRFVNCYYIDSFRFFVEKFAKKQAVEARKRRKYIVAQAYSVSSLSGTRSNPFIFIFIVCGDHSFGNVMFIRCLICCSMYLYLWASTLKQIVFRKEKQQQKTLHVLMRTQCAWLFVIVLCSFHFVYSSVKTIVWMPTIFFFKFFFSQILY